MQVLQVSGAFSVFIILIQCDTSFLAQEDSCRDSESCLSDDSAWRNNELPDWKTGKESPHASEPFTVVKSIRPHVFVSLGLTECVLI